MSGDSNPFAPAPRPFVTQRCPPIRIDGQRALAGDLQTHADTRAQLVVVSGIGNLAAIAELHADT